MPTCTVCNGTVEGDAWRVSAIEVYPCFDGMDYEVDELEHNYYCPRCFDLLEKDALQRLRQGRSGRRHMARICVEDLAAALDQAWLLLANNMKWEHADEPPLHTVAYTIAQKLFPTDHKLRQVVLGHGRESGCGPS